MEVLALGLFGGGVLGSSAWALTATARRRNAGAGERTAKRPPAPWITTAAPANEVMAIMFAINEQL
jgi:hypothetical protein